MWGEKCIWFIRWTICLYREFSPCESWGAPCYEHWWLCTNRTQLEINITCNCKSWLCTGRPAILTCLSYVTNPCYVLACCIIQLWGLQGTGPYEYIILSCTCSRTEPRSLHLWHWDIIISHLFVSKLILIHTTMIPDWSSICLFFTFTQTSECIDSAYLF